jgi:hypothetical protein
MPFVATARQTENYEREWQAANTGDLAVLHYNADPAAPGPPQRQTAEPPIEAISKLLITADTDMKAVTGLFDPSLGQKTPDQSGKAIVALQRQGNVATANFSDNLARSKRELIRGILTWIPIIYDAPRVQRIIKPDGTVDHVGIYNSQAGGSSEDAQQQAQQALQGALDAKAIKKIYDIGVGRYDVTVDVGPSFQTKRQQAAAEIQQLIAAYPEMLHVCGDLMVGQMDIPLAKEIAERIKRTIPPNILGPEDGSDPEETLARVTSELNTMMQQHQQLAQELQQASQVINTKQIEAQAKKEIAQMQENSKMEIVKLQTAAQVEVAGLNAKLDLAKLDFQKWEMLHNSAHEVGMQAVDQEHEQGMAAQQAVTQADSQQSDQDHEADMTAQGQQHEQQMAQQAQENQPSNQP